MVLLDVREPWEHATAHIEGSVLIPMGEIPARAFQELDPEAHIVTICHHGVRSMNVAVWLRNQGFEQTQSLRGGIDAWSAEADPHGAPLLKLPGHRHRQIPLPLAYTRLFGPARLPAIARHGEAMSAIAYARDHSSRFLEELKALLRIPSVSTLPEHKGDVRRAAEVLAAELQRIGMENVRLIEGRRTSAGLRRLAARRGQAHLPRLWPL